MLGGFWAVDLLDASIELAQTREENRDNPAARREAQAITQRYFDLTREQIRLRARRAALTGTNARVRARRRSLTRQLDSIAYEQKVLVGRASELPRSEFLHDITLGARE